MTQATQSPVAVVTGAARGIGLATTQLFLDEGWRVAMIDCDAQELARAHEALLATPGISADRVLAVVCDVSVPEQVKQMATDVHHWGERIDALINNAGVADFGPMEQTDFDRWRTVMQTNLDGVFLCSQALIPALKQTQGAIVNVASISGLRASTLRVAYGTSKAAVIHLTKQQAAELGEFHVRANCVAPGPVRTKLALAVHSPEIIAAYHDSIPLNRYGSEVEIAQAIVFLASHKASYITGQVLAADGGFDTTGVGLPALREADSQ